MMVTVCSRALDGIQPTFVTRAAQGGVAFHQNRIHAQIGGTECGGIAARACAEYQHIAGDVHVAIVYTAAMRARWRWLEAAVAARCCWRFGGLLSPAFVRVLGASAVSAASNSTTTTAFRKFYRPQRP